MHTANATQPYSNFSSDLKLRNVLIGVVVLELCVFLLATYSAQKGRIGVYYTH